jgi:hypothetical protein
MKRSSSFTFFPVWGSACSDHNGLVWATRRLLVLHKLSQFLVGRLTRFCLLFSFVGFFPPPKALESSPPSLSTKIAAATYDSAGRRDSSSMVQNTSMSCHPPLQISHGCLDLHYNCQFGKIACFWSKVEDMIRLKLCRNYDITYCLCRTNYWANG